MLRRAVAGVRHFVGRSSAKNVGKPVDFPRELERAERIGVLRGPAAYLASLWENRHGRRDVARRAIAVPVQRDGRGAPAVMTLQEHSDAPVDA
jgi:hypothetical protein